MESATETPEILGFLIAHRVDSDWELENIVVKEAARGQGIGSMLLRVLITSARSLGGKSICLEVRESNLSARALYQRAGFQKTGVRKSYYTEPPEEAILYRMTV